MLRPAAALPRGADAGCGPMPDEDDRWEGGTARRGGVRLAPDTRARDARAATLRSLTIGYVLALGGVALALVILAWNTVLVLRQEAEVAALINRAGFQRTLAERVLNTADMALLRPAHPEEALALADNLDRLLATHRELMRAGPVWRSASAEAQVLRRRFLGEAGLGGRVEEFASRGHALAQAIAAGDIEAAAVRAMRVGQGSSALRADLHAVVNEYEAAVQAKNERIRAWLVGGTALVLGLLVVLAAFVFRPLSRQVAEAAGRLSREAETDPLTGLLNRRAILSAVEAMMRQDRAIAVVSMDLDHFKETNDSEGHEAGDVLLRAAAGRLRAAVRPGDAVGRLGGDEFIMVMPGIATEAEAEAAARRIVAAVAQPVPFKSARLRLGATAGVALAPIHASTPDAVIRAADGALIRAKKLRRGSVGCATAEDAVLAARAIAVSARLMAVRFDRLEGLTAHLQPVVSLRTGEVTGLEALARWDCPELGPIAPGEFLPAAQHLGLLHLVSRQVRAEALRAYAALRREGLRPGRLALNLSAAELLREDVVVGLEREVEQAGLDLDVITIEITEDAVLDRVAHATLDRLAALRGRGARIALDDFGTGTSGLAQMLRVPLDVIKLDRSFTAGLGLDGRAERIVEGAVRLAHSMGLDVVAEGIETPGQMRALAALRCDQGQGYLWAMAMPAEALAPWLRGQSPPRPRRLSVV